MKPIEWTDDEREAVINAMYGNGRVVPHSPADILDALAPFVAERERQAAARALREFAAQRPLGGFRREVEAYADRIEREDQP